jgi:hypothetical protein
MNIYTSQFNRIQRAADAAQQRGAPEAARMFRDMKRVLALMPTPPKPMSAKPLFGVPIGAGAFWTAGTLWKG